MKCYRTVTLTVDARLLSTELFYVKKHIFSTFPSYSLLSSFIKTVDNAHI